MKINRSTSSSLTHQPASRGPLPQAAASAPAAAPTAQLTDQRNVQTRAGSSRSNMSFLEDDLSEQLKEAGANRATLNKFETLSAADQQKVVDLVGLDNNKLFALLKNGKLHKKASNGKTVLSMLHQLKTGRVQSGVRKNELVKSALKVLSDRDQITQGPHGTCGAASLQQALWKKDPAEMVRIVSNLARNGESTLRKGNHKLKIDSNALNFYSGSKLSNGRTENRSDFNIIFQSAVMRSAALVGGKYSSSSLSSTVTSLLTGTMGLKAADMALSRAVSYDVRKDTGDFNGVKGGNSAANPAKLEGLLEDITGRSFDMDTKLNPFTFSQMKSHANSGKEPMALFHAGSGSMHYVTVTKVTGDKVYYQDTAASPKGVVRSKSIADFKSKMLLTLTQD